MSTFRKKPIEIQAFQIGVDYIPDWAMNKIAENIIVLHKNEKEQTYADVVTLEGTMRADYGDYIIKGVKDEVYPCKEDIFKKTYDIVDEKTEKEKLRDLFVEAIACDKKIVIYTLFDNETIENCIYYNNLGKVFDTFDAGFDDNLESMGGACKIVEAVCVDDLSNYFSDDSQAYISNRIYDKTGIRI